MTDYYKQIVVSDIYDGDTRAVWWLTEPRGVFRRWLFRKALNWCKPCAGTST